MVDGVTWWCRTVFAMAGDASNAATPTADRITFRFVLMFNLVCFRFSTLAAFNWGVSRVAQDAALITKFCQKISCLQGFNTALVAPNRRFSERRRILIYRNAQGENIVACSSVSSPYPFQRNATISGAICAERITGAYNPFNAGNIF
jgi:hypothetical protein